LWLSSTGAETRQASEYEVKAAFLYNFARFVKWPTAAFREDGSFRLCILGPDPFGPVLEETVEGETSHGRPVEVARVGRVDDATACQILFVSRQKHVDSHTFDRLRTEPVLIVGETQGLTDAGAMINFRMEGANVRFEVNVDAAREAGLEVSSKLLKVARAVVNDRR
jgi:hypothetical protein